MKKTLKVVLVLVAAMFLFACGTSEKKKQANIAEAKTLYSTGLKAYNDKEYKNAEKEWKKAIKLDPSNEDAERGLKRLEKLKLDKTINYK